MQTEQSLTPKFVLTQLETRVTEYNARMILESALASSGLAIDHKDELNAEQSHSLCLALIKKGGPAFQVGTQIYKKYLKN